MKGAGVSEDVLSLILGLVIFVVALSLLAGCAPVGAYPGSLPYYRFPGGGGGGGSNGG